MPASVPTRKEASRHPWKLLVIAVAAILALSGCATYAPYDYGYPYDGGYYGGFYGDYGFGDYGYHGGGHHGDHDSDGNGYHGGRR